MSASRKNGLWPGTYFIYSREKEELIRLTLEDQLHNTIMSDLLPEQADSASLQKVLDIGCGAGGWIIENARRSPRLSLVGIDINQHAIKAAIERAAELHYDQRISFHVMNALDPLIFQDTFFDLIHLRLGSSFMRIWEWPKLLLEMWRILRPGGAIMLTEWEVIQHSTSKALLQCSELLISAFFRSGHFFTQDGKGLISHLPDLLAQGGWQNIQTKTLSLTFNGGTTEGELFYQNIVQFAALSPFLKKWGCTYHGTGDIYQQALDDAQKPNFQAIQSLFTIWGSRP